MSLLINPRDLNFLLYDLLEVESFCDWSAFGEHDRATFEAVIDAAYRLAEDGFAGHAAWLDANEPTFDGERVHIIPEVAEALAAYIDSGFMGTAFPAEYGGLQMPYTVSQAIASLFTAANIGTAGYPFLTTAAANLLRVVGSEAQKQRYMVPMIEGRFFGTMCLSEPQAGSSLGDIRTRATPQDDGSYRIVGNKMWISAGEHDLSENIVHMVLARIDGASAGTRGISLFVVPKVRVNEDGSLGQGNDIRLAGLNHKMGYRGTVNTVLNFGDNGACEGFLVGEPGRGLEGMFHMMNEARIAVGMGASVLGYSGYLHSLAYARERPQGRSPGQADPESRPVPIIEHADVRRMLLTQKAYVEGALSLCLYCATLVDRFEHGPDVDDRQRLRDLLDILTPIAKAWPSEYGLKANDLGIQVLGGYGYTREYPLERLYRDNRLNPIHEGTNGIQAIDLLGRKVTMNQGRALQVLLREIRGTADRAAADTRIGDHARALGAAVDTVEQVTVALGEAADEPARYLANASLYLDLLGRVVIAWMWLRQVQAAQRLDQTAEADFVAGKRQACQFFFRRELPAIEPLAALLIEHDDSALAMQARWF